LTGTRGIILGIGPPPEPFCDSPGNLWQQRRRPRPYIPVYPLELIPRPLVEDVPRNRPLCSSRSLPASHSKGRVSAPVHPGIPQPEGAADLLDSTGQLLIAANTRKQHSHPELHISQTSDLGGRKPTFVAQAARNEGLEGHDLGEEHDQVTEAVRIFVGCRDLQRTPALLDRVQYAIQCGGLLKKG